MSGIGWDQCRWGGALGPRGWDSGPIEPGFSATRGSSFGRHFTPRRGSAANRHFYNISFPGNLTAYRSVRTAFFEGETLGGGVPLSPRSRLVPLCLPAWGVRGVPKEQKHVDPEKGVGRPRLSPTSRSAAEEDLVRETTIPDMPRTKPLLEGKPVVPGRA